MARWRGGWGCPVRCTGGVRRLLWVLCLPMRAVSHHVVVPLRRVLAARAVRRKNKSRKKPKKQKNMLQKERKILYN